EVDARGFDDRGRELADLESGAPVGENGCEIRGRVATGNGGVHLAPPNHIDHYDWIGYSLTSLIFLLHIRSLKSGERGWTISPATRRQPPGREPPRTGRSGRCPLLASRCSTFLTSTTAPTLPF